jgi:hypothetical protein
MYYIVILGYTRIYYIHLCNEHHVIGWTYPCILKHQIQTAIDLSESSCHDARLTTIES